MKQSFSWWCFRNRGVADADLLRAAAKTGYAGVEMLPRELWETARDLGLTLVSETIPSISHGLNRREHHAQAREVILEKIALAAEWRIPVLICFSGGRDGIDDEAGLENCAEILRELAPRAAAAGTTLAIELLNSRVDHPGYQADHTAWGARLCEAVGNPGASLLYDIYHMQIMEGDLIRTIRAHHPHISHYHTAGNPGRGPMDQTQEIHYPAIYRAIAETGYAGYIGHEFIPKGNPVEALEWAFTECQRALEG
jgi:hydroxypyruvate isomerase